MGALSSIGYLLKTIWKGDKGCVIFSFYKNCTEEVFMSFFVVYYTKILFTYIQNKNPFMDIVKITLLFCALHICIHIASALYAYYIRYKKPDVYRSMFTRVIDRAQKMELSRYEKPEFYNKFARALDECLTNAIEGLNYFTYAFGELLATVVSIIIVATIDPVLIIFMVPPIIVSLLIGGKLNKEFLALNQEETFDKRKMEYAKRVFYEKKYAQEIRLYNIKNVLFRKHKESVDSRYFINKKHCIKMGWQSFTIQVIRFAFMSAAVSVYVAYMIKVKHTENVGAYLSVLTTAGYITWKAGDTILNMVKAGKDSICMNNLKDFLAEDEDEIAEEKISDSKEKVEVSQNEILGDIEINHLYFTYAGASEPTIKDLNLSVHKGEKIALVGENGAGKTTLIKLLMALYPIKEGEIKVNGVNINDYNNEEYRERFGTVFQDLQIFSLPLAENVLLREPKSEEDKKLVVDSLEKAQFGDKLSTLPLGINTPVTKEFDDTGFVCSGGQAQKIAIARVFAKKPDIVILDEPSSALDPIAEFNMYNNMMQASEGKTVFFISHRLSSARIADRIFYLKNGAVIESGTHDELMKKNGQYAFMFNLQAKNYREHTFQTKEGEKLYE